MLTLALHIENVGVTHLASPVTGKFHRTSRNLCNCCSAVVAILPKAGRNHVASNDEKDDESENEESRKAE
jgi:hypothetical protein